MKLFKKFLPGLKQILNHFCKRVKAANERAAFIEQRVNEMRSQMREKYSLWGGGWHQ